MLHAIPKQEITQFTLESITIKIKSQPTVNKVKGEKQISLIYHIYMYFSWPRSNEYIWKHIVIIGFHDINIKSVTLFFGYNNESAIPYACGFRLDCCIIILFKHVDWHIFLTFFTRILYGKYCMILTDLNHSVKVTAMLVFKSCSNNIILRRM